MTRENKIANDEKNYKRFSNAENFFCLLDFVIFFEENIMFFLKNHSNVHKLANHLKVFFYIYMIIGWAIDDNEPRNIELHLQSSRTVLKCKILIKKGWKATCMAIFFFHFYDTYMYEFKHSGIFFFFFFLLTRINVERG